MPPHESMGTIILRIDGEDMEVLEPRYEEPIIPREQPILGTYHGEAELTMDAHATLTFLDQMAQAHNDHVKKCRPRPTRRRARNMAKLLRYHMRKWGNVVGNDHDARHDDPRLVRGAWVRRHWPIHGDR